MLYLKSILNKLRLNIYEYIYSIYELQKHIKVCAKTIAQYYNNLQRYKPISQKQGTIFMESAYCVVG